MAIARGSTTREQNVQIEEPLMTFVQVIAESQLGPETGGWRLA